MKREFRFNHDPEIRLAGEEAKPVITGYAAVFNSPTQIGKFREVIRPGAFTRALQEKQDVRGLFNHNPSMILGRTKSGTLRLSQDSRGLKYEIDIPDTSLGRDLMESIKRGDIDGSSFGFVPKIQSWSKDGGMDLREIKDCDLHDVSPVTDPAYEDTTSELRAMFPDGSVPEPPEEVAPPADLDWVERAKKRIALAEKF